MIYAILVSAQWHSAWCRRCCAATHRDAPLGPALIRTSATEVQKIVTEVHCSLINVEEQEQGLSEALGSAHQ